MCSFSNLKIASKLKGIDPSNTKVEKSLETIVDHDKNSTGLNDSKVSVEGMFGSKLCYDIIISSC